jgi:DNA repair ATPase RecN
MEIRDLNIEEILERSRKVLMDSMEISLAFQRVPLADKTNKIHSESLKPKYFNHLNPAESSKSQNTSIRPELESLPANLTPNQNKTLKKSQVNLNSNELNRENHYLKQKIYEKLNEKDNISLISNSITQIKEEIKVLEDKYKIKNTIHDKSELADIKNQIKITQEQSNQKIKLLSSKLEALVKENLEIFSIVAPQSNSDTGVEKYKVLVKSLKQKLKKITKKYNGLKNKHTPCISRPKSVIKSSKKNIKDNSKKTNSRGKSSERVKTPKIIN